jgi:hypothetical protein
MRISSFVIPFFVLLAGIIGFMLRLMELSQVFDAVTGFPERGAPISMALIGFSGLIVIAAIFFAIFVVVRNTAQIDFDNAFGTDTFLFPAIYIAVGTVWLVASIIYYFTHNAMEDARIVDLIFSILSSVSAISIIFFAVEAFKDPRRKVISTLSLISTLFMCFWLMIIYRENASNPILLSYAYICLSVVFVALGFYFSSSISFGKPIIGKPIVCYAAAAYFCIVTLADDHPMSIKLIIGALAFLSLFNLSCLVRNLQRKIKPAE